MCSLSNFFRESRKVSTLPIMIFAAFQLLSLGILPPGAVRIMTAAVTLTTASGGDPKDFSSVRLFWKQQAAAERGCSPACWAPGPLVTAGSYSHVPRLHSVLPRPPPPPRRGPVPFLSFLVLTLFRVSRASCAASRAGSALARSVSQAFCFSVTFWKEAMRERSARGGQVCVHVCVCVYWNPRRRRWSIGGREEGGLPLPPPQKPGHGGVTPVTEQGWALCSPSCLHGACPLPSCSLPPALRLEEAVPGPQPWDSGTGTGAYGPQLLGLEGRPGATWAPGHRL